MERGKPFLMKHIINAQVQNIGFNTNHSLNIYLVRVVRVLALLSDKPLLLTVFLGNYTGRTVSSREKHDKSKNGKMRVYWAPEPDPAHTDFNRRHCCFHPLESFPLG